MDVSRAQMVTESWAGNKTPNEIAQRDELSSHEGAYPLDPLQYPGGSGAGDASRIGRKAPLDGAGAQQDPRTRQTARSRTVRAVRGGNLGAAMSRESAQWSLDVSPRCKEQGYPGSKTQCRSGALRPRSVRLAPHP